MCGLLGLFPWFTRVPFKQERFLLANSPYWGCPCAINILIPSQPKGMKSKEGQNHLQIPSENISQVAGNKGRFGNPGGQHISKNHCHCKVATTYQVLVLRLASASSEPLESWHGHKGIHQPVCPENEKGIQQGAWTEAPTGKSV